ncbi:MAG TPA: hypothetical protein VGN95_25515 [Pyrinomonadaceae bacterium]|nr:hypothetical protein [Pyrinomonadaceae bacterium]
MSQNSGLLKLLFVSLLLLLAGHTALAQDSTFTYQGRLTDGSTPATGTYELEFKLFDAASGGTQQPQPSEVYRKFYNQAFVVEEYFGYLRRDPDAMYLQWIDKLDQTGDYRIMIDGFLNSPEYRMRFGP